MLYPFIDDHFIIVTIEISLVVFVVIQAYDTQFIKFSLVVIFLSVSVRISKISTDHHHNSRCQKCCEFFENAETLLALSWVLLALNLVFKVFVVDLADFIINLLKMFGDKVLGKLKCLLLGKTHLLEGKIIFPNQVNEINHIFEGFFVHFEEKKLKKLTEFVLPFEVDSQHFPLNLGQERTMLVDNGRDVNGVFLSCMHLKASFFESWWLKASENILLMFHIFLQLFLEASFVFVHERFFKTDVKRIC